jgi:hypothetical protein
MIIADLTLVYFINYAIVKVSWVTMMKVDESCRQNIPQGLSYVFNHTTTKL